MGTSMCLSTTQRGIKAYQDIFIFYNLYNSQWLQTGLLLHGGQDTAGGNRREVKQQKRDRIDDLKIHFEKPEERWFLLEFYLVSDLFQWNVSDNQLPRQLSTSCLVKERNLKQKQMADSCTFLFSKENSCKTISFLDIFMTSVDISGTRYVAVFGIISTLLFLAIMQIFEHWTGHVY